MVPRVREGRKAVVLIMLLLFILFAAYLHQYLAFSAVCRRIDVSINLVEKRILSARKFQNNSRHLQAERERISRDLETVNARVPGRLDPERIVGLISQAAKKYKVRINKLRSAPRDFDFWRQLDVILMVSGEDADVDTWLKTVAAGERRIDHYLTSGEDPYQKVILTVYATGESEEPGTGGDPADVCRPVEHAVWLWPFPGLIEMYKNRLHSLCSQQWQMRGAVATMLQFKKDAKLLQQKLTVCREIEQRHVHRRKANPL